MHIKSLTLVALSAVAVSAQVDSARLSVLSVLKTAIPADSISRAVADPSAFAADLAASLSAGDTPDWYQALPTNVQDYLPSLYPAAKTTPTPTPTPSSTAAPSSTLAPSSYIQKPLTTAAPVAIVTASISGTAAIIPGNSTVISHVSSATLGATGGANAPLQVSTAGAPRATAFIGAGVAGVFGFVGMLAL